MNNCFISIVSPIHPNEDILNQFLIALSDCLPVNFSHFEIILLNTSQIQQSTVKAIIESLNPDIRKEICIYNFANNTDINNAIVAGLDNAHGDYVILLETVVKSPCLIIRNLYDRTQENYDVVYIKNQKATDSWYRRLYKQGFIFLLRKYSDLRLDPHMLKDRIISRRALNNILKYRSDWAFMIGNLSDTGLATSNITENIPYATSDKSIYEDIKLGVSILLSRTKLPNKIFLYLVVTSILFSSIVIINALMVRYSGLDIFGVDQEYVPGWTFIVVFLAVTFNILLTVAYLLFIYLNTIFDQVRKRPLYTIESIDKY